MNPLAVRCEDCVWVDRFSPRKDEVERNLLIGCKKPGWEGYTSQDQPSCGGVFFMRSERRVPGEG